MKTEKKDFSLNCSYHCEQVLKIITNLKTVVLNNVHNLKQFSQCSYWLMFCVLSIIVDHISLSLLTKLGFKTNLELNSKWNR